MLDFLPKNTLPKPDIKPDIAKPNLKLSFLSKY